MVAWLIRFIAAQRPSNFEHINSSYSRAIEEVARLECRTHHLVQRCLNTAQYSRLFFVRVLNLSLLATDDVALSSLSCLAILVLIDDPQGPPPASPRPVTGVPNSSKQNALAVFAATEPGSNNAAPKRTVQVDMDADVKFSAAKRCRAVHRLGQLVHRSLSLDMSHVPLLIRAGEDCG